jgi:hypothetical protein
LEQIVVFFWNQYLLEESLGSFDSCWREGSCPRDVTCALGHNGWHHGWPGG